MMAIAGSGLPEGLLRSAGSPTVLRAGCTASAERCAPRRTSLAPASSTLQSGVTSRISYTAIPLFYLSMIRPPHCVDPAHARDAIDITSS